MSNCDASFRNAASQISDAIEKYDASMTATVRGLLSGDLVRPPRLGGADGNASVAALSKRLPKMAMIMM